MIFPAFYFGPISYFGEMNRAEKIQIETHENFPKQTYRNRCYILGANGKLRLAIPTKHDGARLFKDLKVSDEFNWEKEHFKSLVSAYKSSPYFEYYEDEIAAIYASKEKFLLDFNLKTMEFINQKLKLELNFEPTESYQNYAPEVDFRNQFSAKINSNYEMETYFQVFDEKFDFEPDLSILDLLCNEGPKSATYLANNFPSL